MHKVRRQLHFFRKIYMKGYELQKINSKEQIVLNSKIAVCECKNCAARIEKRIYFTGECPYCGSSDLFAKVLTDNRFYSIQNQMSEGVKKPEFYVTKSLESKKYLFIVYLTLAISAVFIGIIGCFDHIDKYNDKEYLMDVLLSGESYSSFDLIKSEIMESIIWFAVIALAFIPVVYNRIKKMSCIMAAERCATYLSRCQKPIIPIIWLPVVQNKKNPKNAMKPVRGAIRRRYLLNCTFESHEGELKIALAKKIVKDRCPSCYGAITDAVDENYRCRYCNNMIMDVVVKK